MVGIRCFLPPQPNFDIGCVLVLLIKQFTIWPGAALNTRYIFLQVKSISFVQPLIKVAVPPGFSDVYIMKQQMKTRIAKAKLCPVGKLNFSHQL